MGVLELVRRPGTHRRVQATLHRMLEEERHRFREVARLLESLRQQAVALAVPARRP